MRHKKMIWLASLLALCAALVFYVFPRPLFSLLPDNAPTADTVSGVSYHLLGYEDADLDKPIQTDGQLVVGTPEFDRCLDLLQSVRYRRQLRNLLQPNRNSITVEGAISLRLTLYDGENRLVVLLLDDGLAYLDDIGGDRCVMGTTRSEGRQVHTALLTLF